MIPPDAGLESGADRPDAVRWDGSRRLWSLWDILFSYHTLVTDLHFNDNPDTSQLLRDAKALRGHLQDIGFRMSAITAGHVIMHLEKQSTMREIQGQIERLHGRIHDELKIRLLFILSSKEADLFEKETPFGNNVATLFPSVAYEIEEAAKCLALNRSTASAFHSIRCLEAGIRAISRCLGIPDPTKVSDRSWFKALKSIKDELDKRWPTASDRLAGDGRFFEEAYAALAAMQNPYRNATMHMDQKYTETEAKYIFDIASDFMQKLAARCNEDGVPAA